MRRAILAALFCLCGAAPSGAAPVEPWFHTTLEASTPADGERTPVAPTEVRLRFGGPVETAGASVTLVGSDGHTWTLDAVRAEGDIRLITAPMPAIGDGAYRVEWRVVSADGHPVSGDFVFWVGESSAGMTPPPPTMAGHEAAGDHQAGGVLSGTGLAAVAVRVAGDLALLALAGLLTLASWGALGPARATVATARALSVAAPLLAAAYAWAWVGSVLGGSPSPGERLGGLLTLTTGRALAAETALAVLVPWALLLAQRPRVATVFALLAVGAGAAAGHPAAYTPAFAVPSAVLHVVAAAMWTGGLLLLVTERGASDFRVSAHRVSTVALVTVAVLAATGVAQTWLLLGAVPVPWGSAYDRLLWVKVVGFVALIGFGAYHRRKLLPALAEAGGADRLSSSVRRELVVLAAVLVAAAVLSHIPPTTG